MESSMNYSGLTVKHGRLINNRPTDKTGIQEMAENRKAMKMAKKVSQIAEGTHMGNMMHTMMGRCTECGGY